MKKALTLVVLIVTGMTLASLASPSITSQPQNQAVLLGQTAIFSVGAQGIPPLSYQWWVFRDGEFYESIYGATNSTAPSTARSILPPIITLLSAS
jgi:hypothetical protein